MNESTETRELIILEGVGGGVRGTHHKVDSARSGPIEKGRVGILFLNSLFPTRAATGDSAVYWADSFAADGYPSFRLDFPGFGDTGGDTPTQLLQFINEGGYAPVAAMGARELVARFRLSGVVFVGLCAGAVSALYAAAACKECKGLILMDPYFHLPQAVKSRVGRKLIDWSSRSSFVAHFSDAYARLRRSYLLLRGNLLPDNANVPLLKCWSEVASAGLPIFLLKAPTLKSNGIQPPAGEFDYLKHVLELSGRMNRVVVKLIEGTDHSFANRLGRAAVRFQTQTWLSDNFPLKDIPEPASRGTRPASGNNPANPKNYERCVTA